MEIDAKSFFILVATLAAGGAGGYVASEKHLLPPLGPKAEPLPPPVTAVAPPASTPSVSVSVSAPPPPAPSAPLCDDTTGVPGDCPGPGLPTVEGGCGSFAATRCGEFKQAMKPRVAKDAVACVDKLTPQERCNPQRVNLCGHAALMSACPEPDMSPSADASAPPASVTTLCQGLAASCATSSVALSQVDCQRTLAGMTTLGRERMTACLKKHCGDRGLLLCEAVAKAD